MPVQAISNCMNLLYPKVVNPEEENEEDNVIEDVIQLPTKHELMGALEVLQTCTFYDTDYGDEMHTKVNPFLKAIVHSLSFVNS